MLISEDSAFPKSQVNLNKTSLEKTCCLTNHLTSFGGFYVAPNPLPPLTSEGFKQGYALTITVGVVLLFYLTGLIILRRFDIADKEKVCFLHDGLCTFEYRGSINLLTYSLFCTVLRTIIYGKNIRIYVKHKGLSNKALKRATLS